MEEDGPEDGDANRRADVAGHRQRPGGKAGLLYRHGAHHGVGSGGHHQPDAKAAEQKRGQEAIGVATANIEPEQVEE